MVRILDFAPLEHSIFFKLIENVAAGIAMGMVVYFFASVAKFARVMLGAIVAGFIAVACLVLSHGPRFSGVHSPKIVLLSAGFSLVLRSPSVRSVCHAPSPRNLLKNDYTRTKGHFGGWPRSD